MHVTGFFAAVLMLLPRYRYRIPSPLWACRAVSTFNAWLHACLALTLMAAAASAAAQAVATGGPAGKRVALLIGNADYSHERKLRNPVNDAQLLGRVLKDELKFDLVQVERNLNAAQFDRALERFAQAAAGAGTVVLYFSGHGLTGRDADGNRATFLLPTDAKTGTPDSPSLDRQAVNARQVRDRLRKLGSRITLLILDACRDGPGSDKSGDKGLARIGGGNQLLVAYATEEGYTAADGDGANSPYADALARAWRQTDKSVLQQLDFVYDEVKRKVPQQEPTREGNLRTDAFLGNPFLPVTPDNRAQIEDEAWGLCRSATTVVPCEDYLSGWPQGRYRGLAQTRLRELRAQAAVPAVQPGAAPAVAAPAAAGAPVAGSELKDCEDCPTLVVLARGSFSMGSPDSEVGREADEGPVRQVNIAYGLAVGKYEVSVGEFGRFVQATGYRTEAERDVGNAGCAVWTGSKWEYTAGRNWRSPGFSQTDSHPVVCVSWNDAQEYLKWLNGRASGKGFRLLSEAEWEYAARAGQGARRYPWGDDVGASEQCGYANGMDATGKAQVPGVTWTVANCSDGHAYTAPGNALRANAFGLHHMHGNAWEWVQDVWHDNYQGAPTDGAAWTQGGDQARRVLRGGSWNSNPQILRSANRNWFTPDNRYVYTGFRIARTF